MTKTLVALYDDMQDAHRAHREINDAGIGADISFTALDENGRFRRVSGKAADRMADGVSEGSEIDVDSVVRTLEKDGLPSADANAYAEGVRRGNCLLVVHASDERADEAAVIMDRNGALPIDQYAESWRAAGWTGFNAAAGTLSAEERRLERERTRTTAGAERRTGETRVPLAEEEMHVGKRVVPTGSVRIHSFVRETPVEESVRLRDERVDVERRATDRPADASAFEERTIEMEERHEEPVISKEARVTEEVVVSKGVEEHEEKVRDTVRRTDIDVEGKPEQRPERHP